MSYFGATRRYVGDPGFFDTIKRIGGAVLKGATGIPGAVVGELLKPSPRAAAVQPINIAAPGPFPTGSIIDNPVARQVMMNGARNASGCPKGYQPKKVYVPGQGYQRIGHCVKIRSRNPYNKRAASRAAARLSSLGRGMKTIRKSVKSAARELD